MNHAISCTHNKKAQVRVIYSSCCFRLWKMPIGIERATQAYAVCIAYQYNNTYGTRAYTHYIDVRCFVLIPNIELPHSKQSRTKRINAFSLCPSYFTSGSDDLLVSAYVLEAFKHCSPCLGDRSQESHPSQKRQS